MSWDACRYMSLGLGGSIGSGVTWATGGVGTSDGPSSSDSGGGGVLFFLGRATSGSGGACTRGSSMILIITGFLARGTLSLAPGGRPLFLGAGSSIVGTMGGFSSGAKVSWETIG